MPKPETIQEYLDAVTEQIRWKRAQSAVAWELRRHIEEQRDAFASQGHDLTAAERLAVQEMGDPVSVGAELDRIHRPKPQRGLLLFTLLLTLTGCFLRVWLTGQGLAAAIAAVGLGTAALLAGYLLDSSRLFSHSRTIYLAALAAGVCLLYLSPPKNNTAYYAQYVAQLYPVVYALWLYSCRGPGWKNFFLAIAGGVPLTILCMMIPSMSSVTMLFVSALLLLLTAVHMDWFQISKRLAAVFLLGLTLFLGLLLFYGIGGYPRLRIALHPALDPQGRGYLGTVIQTILAEAQWLGAGHELPFPFAYLPEWNQTCLLATLVYKLGWLPFLLLAFATAALLLWMLWKCLRQSSQTGRMLVLAVVTILGLQMLLSIAINMGFVLFGAEFPLLVGNLRTVINMGLIGLALSAFRGDNVPLVPDAGLDLRCFKVG